MKLNKKELRKLILQEVAVINEQNTFGNQPGGPALNSALEHLVAADSALHVYEMETNTYRTPELDEALGLIHAAIAIIDPAHQLARSLEPSPRGR